MKYIITDEYGKTILRDKTLLLPNSVTDDNQKILSNSAKNGDIFYVDNEDPVENIKVEIVTEKESVQNHLNWYESVGGSFLFNNISGEVVLTSLEDWVSNKQSGKVFKLEQGCYSVEVFSRDVENLDNYYKELSKYLSKGDLDYYHKTYGLTGCLPTLIVIPVMIFASLKIGLLSLLIATVFWFPFIIKAQSKRYKKIAERVNIFDKESPHFILLLTKIDSDKGLVGGYVR